VAESDPSARPAARVIVLATTDLHHQLWPHDFTTDRPAPGRGLGLLVDMIGRFRASGETVLLVDNGDCLQGTPQADLAARKCLASGCPPPMIEVMNALGYDAAALGNHDFDYGPALIRAALAAAKFPILSANVAFDGGPPGTALLERTVTTSAGAQVPLRIGIVGFAPESTAGWPGTAPDPPPRVAAMVPAAKSALADLACQDPDIVLMLCHAGLEPDDGWGTAGALEIAALPGVDAVVAGHTHEIAPPLGTVTGSERPAVVLPGAFGRHLGVLRLDLDRLDGRWRVAGHSAEVLKAPEGARLSPAAEAILAPARPGFDRARTHGNAVLGETPVALSSHLAPIGRATTSRVLAQAMRRGAESLLAASGVGARALPLLVATSPPPTGDADGAGAGLDIEAGAVLCRHAEAMFPFADTIAVLRLSGAGLRRWLENSARVFEGLPPGVTEGPLFAAGRAPHDYDTIWGLHCTVDLSVPAGTGRIGDLRVDGRPVCEGDQFALATTSFRAAGGGQRGAVQDLVLMAQGQAPVREALAEMICAGHWPDFTGPPPWRFAPKPGHRVWFPVPPRAEGCARAHDDLSFDASSDPARLWLHL
jgi:2',3'-cyclic-nucleotide 2'-phosphodiesterase/3'-nucleotidase